MKGRLLRGPALVALGIALAAGGCSSDTGAPGSPDDAITAARSAGEVSADADAALGIEADVASVTACLDAGTPTGEAATVAFTGDGSPGLAVIRVPAAAGPLRAGTGDAFGSCIHDALLHDIGEVGTEVSLDVTTQPGPALGDASIEIHSRLHAGPFGLGDDIVLVAVGDLLVIARVSSQDTGDIDHAPIQAPLEAAVRALG